MDALNNRLLKMGEDCISKVLSNVNKVNCENETLLVLV